MGTVLVAFNTMLPDLAEPIVRELTGLEAGLATQALARVGSGLVVLLIGGLCARLVAGRWRKALTARFVDGADVTLLSSLAGWGAFLLAGLVALAVIGADPIVTAVLAGAIAIGLLLVANPLFAEFGSGLLLRAVRGVRAGDRVTIGGGEATVVKVGAAAVELTMGASRALLPNRVAVGCTFTRDVPREQGELLAVEMRAPMHADPELAAAVLRDAAAACDAVSSGSKPVVELTRVDSSSLVFTVTAVAAGERPAHAAASDVRFALLKALRVAGIGLPHPQLDIHLRDLDGVKSFVAAAIEERRRRGSE